MSVLRQIRSAIFRFFGRVRRSPKARPTPRIAYERVEDFPEALRPATFYVAGDDPHVWAAAMLCPCGCGATIHLNLIPQQHPCWSVRIRDRRFVSVTPSVWRTKGCQSHFFVRDGRIEWCRPERSPD